MDAFEYAAALNAQGAIVYKIVHTEHGTTVEWNEDFRRLAGLSGFGGQSSDEFSGLLSTEYAEWEKRLRMVIATGEPESWQHSIRIRKNKVMALHTLCRTADNVAIGIIQDLSSTKLVSNDIAIRLNILEYLPVGVYFIDQDYRIQWTNHLGTCQSHINWKEHYGDICYKLPFSKGERCDNCPVAKTFEDGGYHSWEREMPNDKTWLITSTPTFDQNDKLVGAIEAVIDITDQTRERKRTLALLSAKQNQLQTQLQTIKNLQREYAENGLQFGSFLERIAKEVVSTLNVASGQVWLNDEGFYRCITQYSIEKGHSCPEIPAFVREYYRQTLSVGEQSLVEDVSNAEMPDNVHRYFMESGVGAMLFTPIRSNNNLLGFMVIANDSPDFWKVEEQSFAMAIADLVSLGYNHKKLEAKRRQLDTLLANLPGAAFRLRYGADEVMFEYLSEGIRDLAGFSKQDAENNKYILKQVIFAEDYPAYHELHIQPHNLDDTIETMFRFGLGNGKIRWALERSKVIEINAKNGTITYEGFVHDITERMRLKEAELANEAKSSFLAAMSHEIRTPLNAIIGFTHLIRQTEMNPGQQAYVNKIGSSANVLLEIINTVLDFSKIEAGKMEFVREVFNLHELVGSISNMFTEAATAKGVWFVSEIDPDIPLALEGDELHIKQVLINLLGNALKFTDQGEVSLNCRLVQAEGQDMALQFKVKDTGIGMTAEQLDKAFQAFVQADGSVSRRYGGTGLGLSITKSLVELMQGEMSAKSEPGAGTEFVFTCRVWPSDKQIVIEESLDVPPRFDGNEVLLVEDNEINVEIAVSIMEDVNLKVSVAENGQVALDMIGERGPDNPFALVLMDIQMPVMDGITATQQIRKMPGMEKMPIVAMTAHALDSERKKSLEAGMNDHVSKPIDVGHFYKTLQKYLG